MGRRKSLSVRVRFEVFKRDRFTCAYCGKHPPNVLLEVDHIVPVAAGGDNDPTNLVTSCQDCNRGKGASLLEEGTTPVRQRENAKAIRERAKQVEAYTAAVAEERRQLERQAGHVMDAWAVAFAADKEQRGDRTLWVFNNGGVFPDMNSVRRFVPQLDLVDILEAVDVTASRFYFADDNACRYFYGCCWRKIREYE